MKKTLLRGIIALGLILVAVSTVAFLIIKSQKSQKEQTAPIVTETSEEKIIEENLVPEKPAYLVDDGSLVDYFLRKGRVLYTAEKGFYIYYYQSEIEKIIELKKSGFFNELDDLDKKYIALEVIPEAFFSNDYVLAKELRNLFVDDNFYTELYEDKAEYENYKNEILTEFNKVIVYNFDELNSIEKLEQFLLDFLPSENMDFLKNYILSTTIPGSFKMDRYLESNYAMAAPIKNIFSDVEDNFFLSLENNSSYLNLLDRLDRLVLDEVLGELADRNRLKLDKSNYTAYKFDHDKVENLLVMEDFVKAIFPDEKIDYSALLKEALEMGFINIPLDIIENHKVEFVNNDIYQQAFLKCFGRTMYSYSNESQRSEIIKLAAYIFKGMDAMTLSEKVNSFFVEKRDVFLFDKINAFYNAKLILGDNFNNEFIEKELLAYFEKLVSSDLWMDKAASYLVLDLYENYLSEETKDKISMEYKDELKDKMARLLAANGGGMDGDYLLNDITVLKSLLDQILSKEEINELAYDGIYSRLEQNYLDDSIKILRVFFPDKLIDTEDACAYNLVYLNEGKEKTFYCVKGLQLNEKVENLALQKFEEFLSKGWIKDSYRIYHYFLNNAANETKVKELVNNYYKILADRSWNNDVTSIALFYQYISPDLLSDLVQEYKTGNIIKKKVIEDETTAGNKLTADIIRQRYDDEYYSFADVSEMVKEMKNLDDNEAMIDLAKYMYLDTLADAGIDFFLLAEKIRLDFGLSYKDFDKEELSNIVKKAYDNLTGHDLSSLYFSNTEFVNETYCWRCDYVLSDYRDDLENLFDYVGIASKMNKDNIAEILSRLADDNSLYFSFFNFIRKEYPYLLSDSSILADEKLKGIVLALTYDAIDNLFLDGMGGFENITFNYQKRKIEVVDYLEHYLSLFKDDEILKSKLLEKYKLLNNIVYIGYCDDACFKAVKKNFVVDYLYNFSDNEMAAVEDEIYNLNKEAVKEIIGLHLSTTDSYDRYMSIERILSTIRAIDDKQMFGKEILADLVMENKDNYSYCDNLLTLLMELDKKESEHFWVKEFVTLLNE